MDGDVFEPVNMSYKLFAGSNQSHPMRGNVNSQLIIGDADINSHRSLTHLLPAG